MLMQPQDLIKILLAILLGGILGAEREARDKSAGFRTMIVICLGATLFTMISLYMAHTDDPTRVAASVVVGIGFLGAGAIIRDKGHIMGLTTAATTWLAAAIGLTVGAGYYAQAISATLAGLIVLLFFPSFEASFDRLRHIITYEVGCDPDLNVYKHIESVFTQNGLRLRLKKRSKSEGQMTIVWEAFGSPEAHDQVVQSLLQDERVHELTY